MGIPAIRNSVGMTVTSVSSAGVGTITLGAALSGGYQTAATAYGADANIDIRIEEGDTWEICRDCTYTHSGTTLSRGTLEDGSSGTGTRVAFTDAAKVYVVESAERLRRTVSGYLEHASHDGTAAVTGVVGTLHVFTGLTADRVFTLPASAQEGDRIGVAFPVGSASYEILLKSASGDKINNADCSSTEWSRLFIAGETVIFRCADSSTVDWIVEYDGRIPAAGLLRLSTAATTSAANTFVYATSNGGAWTADTNVGSVCDTSTDKINIRRTGRYNMSVAGRTYAVASAANKYMNAVVEKNGTDALLSQFVLLSISGLKPTTSGGMNGVSLSAGDYVRHKFRTEEANGGMEAQTAGIYAVHISCTEVL